MLIIIIPSVRPFPYLSLAIFPFVWSVSLFYLTGFMEELQLPEETRNTLSRITDLFGNEDVLDTAEKLADNEISKNAVKRLKDLLSLLKVYGVSDYVSFDVGMLSKYHYYTGIIFKA